MLFRVLGTLQAFDGNQWRTLSAAKWRSLLATLLIDPGRVVTLEQMATEMWGACPPRTVANQVYGYVTRLRRVLGDTGGRILVNHSPGYRLAVEDEDVDAGLFAAQTSAGMAALRSGNPDEAARMLSAALALWRGPAFADIPATVNIQAAADHLCELRIGATEARIDADLACGRHAELVPELQALIREHPLREGLWRLRMLALYRCGRQAEALAAYQSVRRLLDEELGIEPGAELRELHRTMLRGQDGATLDAPRPKKPDRGVVPAQLPPAIAGFIGRAGAFRRLDATMADRRGRTNIAVISGTAGVGKTALALCWGHRVRAAFPDGQLYANLRGFDDREEPIQPAAAVGGFLDALGVSPARIPSRPDDQFALYRSLVADRKILVILDNVRDAEQVRPLLPGGSPAFCIVTSRNPLAGLVAAETATPVVLDLLTRDEARELLATRLGVARVAADPHAVDRVVDACARLPLALTIVAARAALLPATPLRVLVGELGQSASRLDALGVAGDRTNDVRSVLSWSYRVLTPAAARLFRLLALHPRTEFEAAAAASLAAIPPANALALLQELQCTQLIAESGAGRFGMHDLLHEYAAERVLAEEPAIGRATAVVRLLDYYLRTACGATARMLPNRPVVGSPDTARFACYEDALAWFETHSASVVAAVELSYTSGNLGHTWQLAWSLAPYLRRRCRLTDWISTQQMAVWASARNRDRPALSRSYCQLATATQVLGDNARAERHARRALSHFEALGDSFGVGNALFTICLSMQSQGRFEEALSHAERMLAAFTACGHESGQARARNTVGWYNTLLGRHDLAIEHCQEALRLLRRLGDRPGEAHTLDTLGYAFHRLGDQTLAVAHLRGSIDLLRQLGDRFHVAEPLTHLGDVYVSLGEIDAARLVWTEALDELAELRHQGADRLRHRLEALASQQDQKTLGPKSLG